MAPKCSPGYPFMQNTPSASHAPPQALTSRVGALLQPTYGPSHIETAFAGGGALGMALRLVIATALTLLPTRSPRSMSVSGNSPSLDVEDI